MIKDLKVQHLPLTRGDQLVELCRIMLDGAEEEKISIAEALSDPENKRLRFVTDEVR